MEPSDVLALGLALRLATNAATNFAAYMPQKAMTVKDLAPTVLVQGLSVLAGVVVPSVTGAVDDAVSTLGTGIAAAATDAVPVLDSDVLMGMAQAAGNSTTETHGVVLLF